MTDPIWPWADSHQSTDRPWLRNVSTSATLAKGEDNQNSTRKILGFKTPSEVFNQSLKRVALQTLNRHDIFKNIIKNYYWL